MILNDAKNVRNHPENGVFPFTSRKGIIWLAILCDRKTEYCHSLFPLNASAAPKNGALPFTFLLFMHILYVETNLTYDIIMAGKTKEMSQIKQLLLLKKQAVSNRKAAQIIGINKGTVNHYVNKVENDELSIDELLKLDDPVLEHRLKEVIRHIQMIVLKRSKSCYLTCRTRWVASTSH